MTVTQDFLGPGYTARTLELRGENVATLVHRSTGAAHRGAVLYLHGFVDYFFQTHLAEFFTDRGWDFYALDLRRYGRSLRDGDVPWFTTDLTEYDEELDLAIQIIRDDRHERIIAMGHSAGGLILPLWLDRRRAPHPVDALVLNSPWLDLQYNVFLRTVGTGVIDLVGRVRPTLPVGKLGAVYPQSIHASARGEWDFRTDWKPLEPVPTLAGWLRTIRHGHARMHKGLGLELPILLMRSARSMVDPGEWSPEVMTADVVLDVDQMERWTPMLGSRVISAVVSGGVHDLVLSPSPVRERVLNELELWLETTLV
jgi:alpha-beta hydrolase superfamily lysophospholipase